MRTIRRILVALKDPGAGKSPALAKAVQLAKACGAELELFHAISSPLYVDPYVDAGAGPQLEREIREKAVAQLDAQAAALRRLKIKVTTAAVWDYPVYEGIVRRATQRKADLIIAERHGGRHFAPRLLHLTDWELLRLSPIPVLLVKTKEPYTRPVVLAAIDPGHMFSKPLQLDREILRAATTLTRILKGKLHAVHAYMAPPVLPPPYGTVKADTVGKLEARAAAAAQRRIDRALRLTRIPKSHRHLVHRHPTDAIADTARELQSAIVVLGAVSRSGLTRLVIGNTAEGLLDYLDCDILVVKPAHFPSRVSRRSRGIRFVAVATSPMPI